MEWILELALIVLLAATLLQAIRLERALGVLKRDRGALEALVVDFNTSTHQAESGIQRLRAAADGAGRKIDAQIVKSISLKDDLAYLTERGDRLADRLDTLIRLARPLPQDHPAAPAAPPAAKGQGVPVARSGNTGQSGSTGQSPTGQSPTGQSPTGQSPVAGQSKAERELLQALRLAR